jgi:hypothetical protein
MTAQILVFKSNWGMDEAMPQQLQRIAEGGYDGIEGRLPDPAQAAEFAELLQRYKLKFIPMIFSGGPDHLASFEQQLEQAAKWKPLKITAHSGKDYFSADEHLRFFKGAVALEKKIGVPVAHETHRGRALYSPWNTAQLLKAVPELNLNADFSHWCCVSESMMEETPEMMDLACRRSIHIHGRVGYEEGPQVPHPAAPEYKYQVEKHEAWWDAIIRAQMDRGETLITFTPEFGPAPYMPALPFTGQPVSDLWQVCAYMAQRFRSRFAELHA